MGIIDEHRLVDYNMILMDPAYVHITKESLKTVKSIKAGLKEKKSI